jgi:hypothetical protein
MYNKGYSRGIKRYIVLIIVVVSSVASFYLGSLYANYGSIDDEENYTTIIMEMGNRLEAQNSTISDLNNDIIELDEQLSNYKQLDESFISLTEDYSSLQKEYDEFEIEYKRLFDDLSQLKSQLRSEEDNYTILIGNMVVTLPQEYIVYMSGLYEDTAGNNSGILTASGIFDDTLISFSWDTLESEPDPFVTLDNAYDSLGLVIEHEMYQTLSVGDWSILYSSFKTVLKNEYIFMKVATWFDDTCGKQYICVVQNTEDDVMESLLEFVSGIEDLDK